MDLPLTDMSNEPVIRAIEENTAEFLLALGRAAGSEEHSDASIQWTIGGSPIDITTAVVRGTSPDTTGLAIDAVLERRVRITSLARGILAPRCGQPSSARVCWPMDSAMLAKNLAWPSISTRSTRRLHSLA